MTSVYARLKNLQITLPDVPPPVVDGYVAAFVPFVRTGNLIYLSGRLAKKNGKLWCGKLGEEITIAEGKQAARGVTIEQLIFPDDVHDFLLNRNWLAAYHATADFFDRHLRPGSAAVSAGAAH